MRGNPTGPMAAIEALVTAEAKQHFKQTGETPPTMYVVVRSEVADGKLNVRVDYEEDWRIARHMVMRVQHEERIRQRRGTPIPEPE